MDNCELIRRATRGDEVALTVLLKNNRWTLCAFLARRIPRELRGRIDSEDLVQETHVRIFRYLGTYDPKETDSFDRWIHTIAENVLRDTIKMQKAQKRGGRQIRVDGKRRREDSMIAILDLLPSPEQTPSYWASRKELIEAMQNALTRLPEHYRKALEERYIKEKSVAQAASQLQRSSRSIHALCRRGLRLLHQQLAEESPRRSAPQSDKG